MVGLWEQVGGIFWSVPPAAVPVEDARPLSTIIICGVLAAFVVTAVLKYISHKIRPQGWGLRKYLGAIGAALTLAYVAVVLPIIWGRVDTLLTMPLNEVGDFLAGAFGPLAILWLVLGFLQQGEELRQNTKALEFQGDELKLSTEALLMQAEELKNSVEQQSIMAAAAKQQIEAQKAEFEQKQKDYDKSLKAIFTVRMGSSGSGSRAGVAMNEVIIRNDGNHAYKAYAEFSAPFLNCEQIPLGHLPPGRDIHLRLDLTPTPGPMEGEVVIAYEDKELNTRSERFTFTVNSSRTTFTKVRV